MPVVRYKDALPMTPEYAAEICGYRDGVDQVLEYIESTHSYPKLLAELTWAIEEGII